MEKQFKVKIKVSIRGESNFFGPGIVELMRCIERTGSVKEGCQAMGLSYSKGWAILNRAEGELGYSLIRRNHGGREGGGASVTPEGKELMSRFDVLQSKVSTYAKEVYEEIFGDGLAFSAEEPTDIET